MNRTHEALAGLGWSHPIPPANAGSRPNIQGRVTRRDKQGHGGEQIWNALLKTNGAEDSVFALLWLCSVIIVIGCSLEVL